MFGAHWNYYLLSNYFIQSSLVASVVYLSIRHVRVSKAAALGIGLLCFVSPAFDNGALYSTSFAFDILAAFVVITGLNLLLSGNLAFAWVFFATGLFIKETAFFAPLSAGVVLYAMTPRQGGRRLLVSASFLIPYAIWGLLHEIAFGGGGGIYAVPTGGSGLYSVRVLKEFLRWPVPFEVAFRSAAAPRPISFSIAIFAAMNLCFWITAFHYSLGLLRNHLNGCRRGTTSKGAKNAQGRQSRPDKGLAILVFCVGSIIILLLIPNLQPRFGATFLALFGPLIFILLQRKKTFLAQAFAWTLLIVPPIFNITHRIAGFPVELSAMRSRWAMAADYASKISHASFSTVYVVDDLSGGFSSTDSIRKFVGYRGQLVRVNDLVSWGDCAVDPAITIHRASNGDVQVLSEIQSSCAGHAFISSRAHYPIGGGYLSRPIQDGSIIYHGVPASKAGSLSSTLDLSVDIVNPGASSVILIPCPKLKIYKEVVLDQWLNALSYRCG